MARGAGRKPAIANVARPQGFIDDVVYPIASRALRSKPVKKATKGKSRSVARKVESRQVESWNRKSERFLDKSIAREKAGLAPKKRIEKKWRVNTAKESASADYDELWAGAAQEPKYRNERVRDYAKMTKQKIKREFKKR